MSVRTQEPQRYRVADLLVDTATRRVTRGGSEIPLPGLSFDLFLTLVGQAPRVVSVNELMERVWPGRVVNAETVAKRVELVREALGDDSHDPRYIALVRGHGYRLVESVQPDTAPAPSFETRSSAGDAITRTERSSHPIDSSSSRRHRTMLWLGVAAAVITAVVAGVLTISRGILSSGSVRGDAGGADVPSVAVLPFLNLSDDASNAYFSDGVSEELLSALSKVPRLRVASRTSSFAFRARDVPLPEIARALNVDHIVEGSVRKAGDRIRITAQLIDVDTDSHLWSESYDRKLEDIFAIQTEISESIATALKLTLGAEDKGSIARGQGATDNVEAYQLYLRGRQVWQLRGEDNIRQSIRLLTRSVELDPEFALAHAALAQAYVLTPFYYAVHDEQTLELAARSASRALELDATLSAPHTVRGQIASQRLDWAGAEAAYRRAIELNANDATAWYWLGEALAVAGRTRDALEIMHQALERDPISPPLLLDTGSLYLRTGDFARGCPYVQRATEVGNRYVAWLELVHCHENRGDLRAALEAERTAERLAGIPQGVLALVRAALQNPVEKPRALAAVRAASRGNVHLTGKYRALGEFDTAFDSIDAPLRRGNFNELRELWYGDAAALRAHPRFRELVERVGLVDYWRQSGWPDLCRARGDSFACE